MASKYMKKCSTSLVIKEMQIKITLRFQLIPVRMAVIKGNNNEDVAKQELLYTAVGMQISTATMESSMEIPQKN
jgi:hypothetical protein